MACELRAVDEVDPTLPNDDSRMEKLQNLVCGGGWGNRDDLCLIHWKGNKWVAWKDTNPLPEASVSVASS